MTEKEEFKDFEEDDTDIDTDTATTSKDDELFKSSDMFGSDLTDYDDFLDGGSTPPMQKHSDLLKQLTNFDPFIKDKINGWLGMRWDAERGKFIRDEDIDPIMNTKCAAWCIDYLKTYTRDNNIITHIGEREYKNIVEDIIDVVWMDIGTQMETFGIKNNQNLHRLCVELQHAAELILMGAGDGKYNKLLSTTTSRHESMNMSPDGAGLQYPVLGTGQKRKLGIFGKFKRMLTGG